MPVQLPTFSFADCHAGIAGPGLSVTLGLGSGVGSAKEGFSFDASEDADRMTIGAGGDGVHALILNRSGKFTCRLLKTSPMNGVLQQALNYQRTSSLFWGRNVIYAANPVTGDSLSCAGVAFTKQPSNTWAEDVNVLDWEFNAISISQQLASLPVVAV
jgi:hypothetical protein